MNAPMNASSPPSNGPATKGIVLFAHGSRDPLWRLPIEAVAARMGELDARMPVRCAYLELTTPDLPTAVAALVRDGVTRLTVVPMFLGVGRHAREDLPLLMNALREQHPEVDFVLQPAIGEDARVTDLLARLALS
jgi:sirohydrochlorin cobaltochelatase